MEELSTTYLSFVDELLPHRVEEINSGSHMRICPLTITCVIFDQLFSCMLVEHLPNERARSRRRLMKNFEARVTKNLENAKVRKG